MAALAIALALKVEPTPFAFYKSGKEILAFVVVNVPFAPLMVDRWGICFFKQLTTDDSRMHVFLHSPFPFIVDPTLLGHIDLLAQRMPVGLGSLGSPSQNCEMTDEPSRFEQIVRASDSALLRSCISQCNRDVAPAAKARKSRWVSW